MGPTVVYCPICGGAFTDVSTGPSEGEYREDILSSTQTEWLASFRVIGKAAFTESRMKDDTIFAVSPPAREAEFRSVYIAGTNPAISEWGCMNGTKWNVFDQNDDGVVNYPVHDACIFVTRKMAHRNLQRARPDSLTEYTSLESYYETLIRFHERLTEFPYEEYSDQEHDRYEPYQSDYGRYKLEWEHGYYGAARFADGFTWYKEPGWEWICADFIEIPGLTSYILRHLQPLQATNPLDQPAQSQYTVPSIRETVSVLPLTSMLHKTTSTLESLPNEIIKQIVSFLPVTSTLTVRRCSKPLASKVSLDQPFWRNALLSGDLVPWLWDLDANECRVKDRSGSWDWNQLAQTLLRAKIFERALKDSLAGGTADNGPQKIITENVHDGTGGMEDAPLGLKNRCRLVRLVKDIEGC